jgi:hypothetical protein
MLNLGAEHVLISRPPEWKAGFAMAQVIDMPVDQDALTWKKRTGMLRALPLNSFMSSSWELALMEGCGLLADGQACQST